MKLYVTFTSPYARLARILVLEKALEDRVEIIEAKTRATNSPYYQINPSGRVPYLIDDLGAGMEDSQVICGLIGLCWLENFTQAVPQEGEFVRGQVKNEH